MAFKQSDSPRSPLALNLPPIEGLYNLAVAAVVPALLIVLAFTKARGMSRLGLVVAAPLMFVVLLFVSLFFFCDGCD